MSTRTLSSYSGGLPPRATSGGPPPLIAAIILSLLLHVAGLAGFLSFGPTAQKLRDLFIPTEEGPFIVDVVELPPGAHSNARFKKPARFYADRTQVVEKETFPAPPTETFEGRPVSPLRKAFPGLDAATREAWTKGTASVETSESKKTDKGMTFDSGLPSSVVSPVTEPVPGKTGNASKTVLPARPSLFPSEERLGELERRYEAEAPKGEQGKTLSLNTSELKYQRYLINMKNRIEINWDYPLPASRNGWQGNLQIDFTIKKDGTVSRIKLVKSSNYPVLDDAAITALRLAAPFPPFPAGFSVEEINIKGQFSYIIYDKPMR